MATTPGGLVYPLTTDAFDPSGDLANLAASAEVRTLLSFPSLAVANAWAAANTSAAPDGRLAWIEAENVFYVRRANAWVPDWKVSAPLLTKTHSVSGVSVPANGRASANAGALEVPAGYTHIGFATVITASGDNVVASATLSGTSVWIHFQSKWPAALTVGGTVTALFLRA